MPLKSRFVRNAEHAPPPPCVSLAFPNVDFRQWWSAARQTCEEGDMPALIEKVPGFKKHIRVFIVHTLATTFQDSTRENMEQCLDLVSARAGRP